MILSYSEYKNISNNSIDENAEFNFLVSTIDNLYKQESLTETELFDLFVSVANNLELEFGDETTFESLIELFESFITNKIDEDGNTYYYLTQDCIELYEADLNEADKVLPPAQGGIHQTARNLRGAFNAITGREGQSWYDGLARTGGKVFNQYQKNQTKQAKIQANADAKQQKQEYKLAKLQAKHGQYNPQPKQEQE